MESFLRKIITLAAALLLSFTGNAQNMHFDRAIENEKFNAVERVIKKQIRNHKKGEQYFNGAGSGRQTSFTAAYDSVVAWLLLHKNIEDADWDRCQAKIAIYPGHSTIGAVFKTNSGIKEKCFIIQEGVTGQINILGWRPKVARTKMILRYKKMSDCPGFVKEQKKNCADAAGQ